MDNHTFIITKKLTLFSIVCIISSCSNPKALDLAQPKTEFLSIADGKFTSPRDGTIFRLILGKQLDSNDRGITDVPNGIIGNRGATASRYTIKNKQGVVYGEAESSIAKGFEHLIKFIDIQYERSSGRILVTEDASDALPSKRYILFTPVQGGYTVDYLAPAYEIMMSESGLPSSPPQIIILPEDRVWVEGKIISFSQIPKYKYAFSLGG